jgi:hypothetical protein
VGLLVQFTETQVLGVLHGSAGELSSLITRPAVVPPYISHLKEFLLRTQAAVLARAVDVPSSQNPLYAFVVGYLRQLLGDSSELLLFCSRMNAWPPTADITEALAIQRKTCVVEILHQCLGSLLLSALTFAGRLGLHVQAFAPLAVVMQQVR